MKVIFNITENKNKATFQQEVVKINTSFNQTENIVKPKFQIGYYPLPYALDNYYTKNETDLLLENYYLKTETYSKNEIDNLLDLKSDLSQLNNYYTKSETFSQSQINTALGLKLDKGTYTGTASDLYLNDLDLLHSLQNEQSARYYADQGLENSKQNKLETVSGNTGVGKTDASATEKLDIAGRTKLDGIVINETSSEILPKEIKFKNGKFKAALVDGVEKAVLLEGDANSTTLIDYTHNSNQEIYISTINYSTGYITTSIPHGLTVGVRYVGFVMPNAFNTKDFANMKRDWQACPYEFLNGAEYVEAIDASTIVLKNYLYNIITVNTSDASNVALNINYWHIEVMKTNNIKLSLSNNSIKDFTLEYSGFLAMPSVTFSLNTVSGIVSNPIINDTVLGVFSSIVPHNVYGGLVRIVNSNFDFSIDKKINTLKWFGAFTTRNSGASSYTFTNLNQLANGINTKYLAFIENIGLSSIIFAYAYLRIANGTNIRLKSR